MSQASYGVWFVFLVAGFAFGFYVNKTISSHGDVKSTKAKLPGYRRTRHRSGVTTIILGLVIGIVVVSLFGPHH